MGAFYFIIKDNDSMTYDVKGPIRDDTEWMFAVCDAQQNGFEITCDTTPSDNCSKEEICVSMENYGFARDTDLFLKVKLMGMEGRKPDEKRK